ncbi:MAG: flagellin [Verrucomicrobia bacterium 21-51-4]|nr:MAG: flagellin [Verrucomicrobia bacterium 21-51-4]HQU09074.1 flagellin [Opitutales bacterium]
MALVINSNPAATSASSNLNINNSLLQKSLNRLSSGDKIASPADDAGGLAVSMKMTAALRRTDAVSTNVANAISYLQTQDGGFGNATKMLTRISELRTLANDVTKSSSDKDNYNTEFTQLTAQLSNLLKEKFNGVDLFKSGGANLTVFTSEDGTQSVTITQADLNAQVTGVVAATSLTAAGATVTAVNTAIQNVATLRAKNGAQTSRLDFASEMLTVNRTNLEAANSRIKDTDVAQESTNFARYNILVQSGTAMLAQANASSQIALRLLS